MSMWEPRSSHLYVGRMSSVAPCVFFFGQPLPLLWVPRGAALHPCPCVRSWLCACRASPQCVCACRCTRGCVPACALWVSSVRVCTCVSPCVGKGTSVLAGVSVFVFMAVERIRLQPQEAQLPQSTPAGAQRTPGWGGSQQL